MGLGFWMIIWSFIVFILPVYVLCRLIIYVSVLRRKEQKIARMTQEIEQRLAEKDSTRHQSNDSTIFIVRLREPDKCPTCRFFSLATVDFENGDKESMIHCKRRDCDNWDRENIPEKAPIAFREWS